MATRRNPTQAPARRSTHRGAAAATQASIGAPGSRGPATPIAAVRTADLRRTPPHGPERAGSAGARHGGGLLQIGARRYGPY